MINIEVIYDEPGELDIARQLVAELEDRMGDYPCNVWLDSDG